MAAQKKSFKDRANPALKFITQAQKPTQALPEPTDEEEPKTLATLLPDREPEPTDEPKRVAPGYERLLADGIGPKKKERKSRRVNFLFQPSLYDAIQQAADSLGISANDFCSQVLKHYLTEKGYMHE